MSVPSGDYNNSMSGGPSCSYANLGGYNDGYSMNVAPMGKVTAGAYIVPTWSPISYESLTNKVPSRSGYSDIGQAYGENAGSCQSTYRSSLCGNR